METRAKQLRDLERRMRSKDPAERAEARELRMVELLRDIRGYLQFFVALALIGVVLGIVSALSAVSSSGGY